jgi:nucleoside-diphosphate-sugar epimerase
MKVALVGGAGLIGHHIALRLIQSGHDVLVVDALLVNNLYSLFEKRDDPKTPIYLDMIEERLHLLQMARVHVVQADARDYHLLSKVLRTFQPDKVLHLSAVAHIDRANKDPWNTLDHSMRTLENTMDVCRALRVRQFVFFSSSTVYGDFLTPTVTETSACNPRGIYGSMKLGSELLVRAYGDACGLPYTIIRPCALYGPRCVSGRVTQKFLENAYFGVKSTIEGDGSGMHDFTFIGDLVHGVECVLDEANYDSAVLQTYNLTSDKARSLADLAGIVKKHFPEAEFEFGPVDPEKPSRGTLSCAKARELLGYVPTYSLEEGMDRYVHWFDNFMQKRSELNGR